MSAQHELPRIIPPAEYCNGLPTRRTPPVKPFRCSVCGQRYRNEYACRMHERAHNVNKDVSLRAFIERHRGTSDGSADGSG